MWARKFQVFTQNKSPLLLSSSDVKEFLKYLAIKRNVSASTQNQAFNALLFLFRHVLKKDLYQKDLDADYAGAFMLGLLEKKYMWCTPIRSRA